MRRKTRNTLLALVLLLVALPLLFKGIMYLWVKLFLDDIVEQAPGQMDIRYQGIETEFKGAASVTGLQLIPRDFDAPIGIERVRVETDDPWIFIRPGHWGGQQMDIPSRLRIDVLSIRVPLQKAVIEGIRQRRAALLAQGAKWPDPCDSLGFDAEQLKAMGFDTVTLDLGIDYRFDTTGERLDVALDFDFHDIESISLGLSLQGIVPEDLHTGRLAGVRLVQADTRIFLEPAFGKRMAQHCAARRKLAVGDYQKQLIATFRDNLRRSGVTLGQELQQALERYFGQWGEMRLYIKPGQPLALLQLLGIKSDQLVRTLGISLFINDRPVNDLDVSVDLKKLSVPHSGGSAGTQQDRSVKAKPPARVRIVRRFVPVSVGVLDQYLGQTVRIRPDAQPAREGVLVAIVNGEAQIEQRTHGGKVTSYVPLDRIRSLEVMQEKRQPLQ